MLEHSLTTLYDQSGNGTVEPGETFELDERLVNTGFEAANGISAVLSTSTPGITITQASSGYPDIPVGGTGTNTTRFAGVASTSLACGTLIDLRLAVTTTHGSFNVDFTVQGGPSCYQVSMQTGQPIIPGTTSLGSSCDDCLRPLTFPFPITLYGQTQTEAVASSNGNIQFGTVNTAFINNCLPTSALESALIVYWDDLLTSGGGHGIFTGLTGSPPNRQFVVEWRTGYANRSGSANFEAIFNEGSDVIRMRFGVDVDHGASETVGLAARRDSRRPGSLQHRHVGEP